jgi:RimK family alpha-L-glutamate ligase
MRFLIAAETRTPTSELIAEALGRHGVDAYTLQAHDLLWRAEPGDTVLGRIDVLATLDGVQGCVWDLRRVERRVRCVLNGTGALVAAHDKLVTALRLARAGVAHPRTRHVDLGTCGRDLDLPVVVKPRFGSWGRDVFLCETRRSLERCLRRLRRRTWFRRQGALVQELVPPRGYDLRLIVARGEVVGAIERVAAAGEWRTNVALGGTRRAVHAVPPEAEALGLAAARSIGADLVGVDLLPRGDGYVVLELNGAVDFTTEYSLPGHDVFDDLARALIRPARDDAPLLAAASRLCG